MTIQQLDLNLLLVFDALAKERSVTRGARRVGITQPAMSNALARLREAVGDPLFERNGRTLVPTSKARALAPIVGRMLEELEDALFGNSVFDPARADAVIGLAMSEHWHFVLLPGLLERLKAEAPGLGIRMVSPTSELLAEDLMSGRVDLALFLAEPSRPGLSSETLVEDDYAVVARSGHPISERAMTLADYAACRHVLVAPRGSWADRVERALEAEGLRFQKVLENAHLQAALEIVARTDVVTVLPRRLAVEASRRWPIQICSAPLDLGTFSLALYWHERSDHDPLFSWFRGRLIELVRSTYDH